MRLEDVNFLKRGGKWPHDPDRMDRYNHNERLFRGDQDTVYKEEFLKRLLRKDEDIMVEVVSNFPGAVTKLFTDLLFGERPNFLVSDQEPAKQKWVDSFVAFNRLHRQNIKAALAQSYRGDAIYKLRLVEGEEHARVQVVPAKFWFPLTNLTDITDKIGDVIAYEVKRDQPRNQKQIFVVAEIHLPGKILNQVWRVANGKFAEQVPLEEFYPEDPPAEEVETGIDKSLVFVVPNMEIDDSPFGIDDYEEADTLFRELSVRLSQPSRILDKHSDPNMYGPPIMEMDDDGKGTVKAGGKYIEVQEGERPPGYLAWDGQLEANWKYIEQILKQLYIVTDTNEAAFSLMTGGSIPSGAAMKRLLMRPLARTNRKREFFDDILTEMLQTAAEFERANGRTNVPEEVKTEIEWQDGLPSDEKEDAEVEQIRTGGKPTSSVKSAIRRLDGGSEESIQAELEALQEEEAASNPPISLPAGAFNFGETGEGEVDDGGDDE